MKGFFLILIACFVIGHIQNDLISPSFPDMLDFFHTTPRMFHLISSSYSLGVNIGGFFLGPLSDLFGRKKTLLSGLILLVIGCTGSMLSTNIYSLICLRFIVGVGASAPIVICVAMLFDVYSKQQAQRIVGINNSILTFAKALAPIIGGYLNVLINWQINFLLLSISTITIIILIMLYMQETSKSQIDNLPKPSKNFKNNSKKMFKNYLLLLSDQSMVAYICILGFMACALITYTVGAPIVYIKYLHVAKKVYGFHQGVVWAVFGLFCFLNHYLIKYTNILLTRKLGFILMIIGCISLNITAHFYVTPLLITFSMMLCSAGFALLITMLFTDAMSLYSKLRGASSSVIAFFRNLFVAVSVAIAGYFFNGTILPLTYIISTLVILVILIYIILINKTLVPKRITSTK